MALTTSMVPEKYKKFQPTPSSIKPTTKLKMPLLVTNSARLARSPRHPADARDLRPNRCCRKPVANDGANIATRCHCIPEDATPAPCPHATIARGAAVITCDITAYAPAANEAARRK